MGIKIFLEINKKSKEVLELDKKYKREGVVKFGIEIVEKLNKYFSPEEVVEWKHLVIEGIGEKLRTWKYEDFKNQINENRISFDSIFSIFRINGIWKIESIERKGFVSINIGYYSYPDLGGNIYLDVEVSNYEDITEIIYSSENKKEIVKDLISILKNLQINTDKVKSTIQKIEGENDNGLVFLYSKDKNDLWRENYNYLKENVNEIKEIESRRYYNMNAIFDLLSESKTVESYLSQLEKNNEVIQESGSILLIGNRDDSLERTFLGLSEKFIKLMKKLDSKENISNKVEEAFGDLNQQKLL